MSQNTSVTVSNPSSNLSLYERLTAKYEHLISDDPITENELILNDRLTKIRSIIQSYGEDQFYIAFSGGKDSTVLSALVDMAIPDNKIPRIYANTGIELNMVRDFVFDLAKRDKRIEVIRPSVPIKPMLERDGYPFKSKEHAEWLERFRKNGWQVGVERYFDGSYGRAHECPKCLKYQFTPEFTQELKVSDSCCENMKEKPLDAWGEAHGRPNAIIGIMRSEHGRRSSAQCLAFKGKKLKFQPMAPLSKEWEEWFIEKYHIEICDIYKPPYNFERTGCKGCPFNRNVKKELDTLEKFFPNERKQCEDIWQPVYAEYRRIGYRLDKEEVTCENKNRAA